jgi:hypothetical protein
MIWRELETSWHRVDIVADELDFVVTICCPADEWHTALSAAMVFGDRWDCRQNYLSHRARPLYIARTIAAFLAFHLDCPVTYREGN